MREGESAGSGVTRTQSRSIAFSPSYSSPEQITHTRTGPWTDVHALGLVFTEALTGKPPLPVYELSETYREVLSGVRPTPAKFGMDVGAWEPVLAKAVAYRPDERYQTAGALLAALLEAMPGARHQALKPGERVSSAPVSAPAPAPVSMPMAAPAGPATLAPPPGSLEPRKVTSAFAGVVLTEPPKAPGPSRTTLIAGAVLVLGIGGAVAMVVAATRSTDPSVGVPSATATPTATEAPTATAMMTAEPTATVFVPSPLGTMMPTASTGVPLRGPVGRPGPRGR
jgi:hypothetical protein